MGFERPSFGQPKRPEAEDEEAVGRGGRRELLGGFPVPADKAAAFADVQHGLGKRDAASYWKARLSEEGDAVPADVRAALAKELKRDEDVEAIERYVGDRVAATRYWLARQNVMSRLHDELKRIDDREDVARPEAPHVRTISHDEATGEMYAIDADGRRGRVTIGDIAADRVWGLTYRPDGSFPEDLWRKVRKLSAIRGARLEIDDLTNLELVERESVSLPTSSWSLEDIEKHPQSGVVAERMAQTLIARIQYDRPDLGVRVESSNAIEDAELKYDFKVVFPEHRRGVAIEGPPDVPRAAYVEEKRRLGVQFTINTLPETVQHKEKQIRKARKDVHKEAYAEFVPRPVDDIVLVVVPMKDCTRAFTDWNKAGRPPGGPERFLSPASRQALLKAMFRDKIELTDDELRGLASEGPN